MASEPLLNSWKEIAGYMGRSERTVQRWEKHFGLPVRRPAGKTRSAVIALPSELQDWSRSAPTAAMCKEQVFPARSHGTSIADDSTPALLCIDDHREGLAVRKALLEAVGYKVFIAYDGRSGLRIFEKKHIDLVVLDYSMPDLDGEAIARMLHERNPRIPILLLSGMARSIPGRLLKLVDTFVQKGQPVGVLLSAVSQLCDAESRTGRTEENRVMETRGAGGEEAA